MLARSIAGVVAAWAEDLSGERAARHEDPIQYSPIYPGSRFENTYNFLSIPPNSRNWNGIGNGLGMGK